MDLHSKMQQGYMNSYQTAAMVGLSANVFNRITGSVLIISGQKRQISDGTPKSNIGLQVKFPKNVSVFSFAILEIYSDIFYVLERRIGWIHKKIQQYVAIL